MLLTTDECFALKVPEPAYDGLTCPKYRYALWDSNPGSRLAKEQKSRLRQPVVVPHFDMHPLATRPVYMDDNARPHRSRAVTAYLQIEAVTSVPWPAVIPDLNPIEHTGIWDMLGRRMQAREPSLDDIYCSKFSTGCNPHVLG
jgi:hypothetical protein